MKRRVIFSIFAVCLTILIISGMTHSLLANAPAAPQAYDGVPKGTVHVPVLLFHHLAEEAANSATVTPAHFEEVLAALKAAGFHTITPEQLADFADGVADLPENPVMITFDDGYESNVLLAAPLLRQYDMCGVVFAIGVSVGKDTYKDTGIPITPHFSWEQARTASDVLAVQSHTFDMHHSETLDTENYRFGVMQRDGERAESYQAAFSADFLRSKSETEAETGSPVIAFAYPYGQYSGEAERILKELGVRMTFLTTPGENRITPGNADCLYALHRKTIAPDTGIQEILDYVQATN